MNDMKYVIVCLVGMAICIVKADVTPTIKQLGKSNGDFSFNLYREIISESNMKGSNIFFSPFSISAAMGMVYLGSKGDTNQQIGDVMKFSSAGDERVFKIAYDALLSIINREHKNYTLTSANRLFASDKFYFQQEFLDATQSVFGAGLKSMDFFNKPDESVAEINRWVADNTNQKIKDLLPDEAIDTDTVMFIVNAIYFKGLWDIPFESQNTKNKKFHVTHDINVTMPMMYTQKHFQYAHLDDMKAQIIDIPYQGKDVSMFVILPEQDHSISCEESLNKMMSNFNVEKFEEMRKQMFFPEVKLTLPKFKLTQEMSLKQMLAEMGMTDAFSTKADFSGMTNDSSLMISDVGHKAFVDVNEEGTEAAGATDVKFVLKSGPQIPVEFTADHPFLFLIYEKTTNSILFIGRLVKPAAADGEARALGLFGEEITSGAPLISSKVLIYFGIAFFTLFLF